MALLTKKGYGQVEPNHLSAQRTGQIYAQLPADTAIETLENGSFLKYDYANGACNTTGAGEWLLVFNEVKLYDKARQGYKDFAITKDSQVDGVITPRLLKVNEVDHFTTNLVDMTSAKGARKGKLLVVKALDGVGVLTETAAPADGDVVYQVVKETTMPDGQEAVKVMNIGVHKTKA